MVARWVGVVVAFSCVAVARADVFEAAAKAVAKREVNKSQKAGFGIDHKPYEEVRPDGGILIGFELGLGKFLSGETIYALQPLYRSGQNEIAGQQRGLFTFERGHKSQVVRRVIVRAKPGYAVGAIKLKTGLNIDGLQLVYRKIDGDWLSPTASYESEWVGGFGGSASTIDSDGSPIVGIFGSVNEKSVQSVGLVYVRRKAADVAAGAPKPNARKNRNEPNVGELDKDRAAAEAAQIAGLADPVKPEPAKAREPTPEPVPEAVPESVAAPAADPAPKTVTVAKPVTAPEAAADIDVWPWVAFLGVAASMSVVWFLLSRNSATPA